MTDPQTGLRGYTGHWERLTEAGQQVAHLDAQMTLLRLRRTHAVRRHGHAIDMAVAIESIGLDEELRTLGQSVTSEEENTHE